MTDATRTQAEREASAALDKANGEWVRLATAKADATRARWLAELRGLSLSAPAADIAAYLAGAKSAGQ